jgi:tRNA-specific 2-thiouridylase
MSTSRGKVLLAMSGGVDSSVAAALLLREGYEVVGCFMRLGSPGEALDELVPASECRPVKIGHQGCCSINDAADARLVAAELGIPFYVCNFKKDFGRIIDYFVDEYVEGRTPNPCVRCNDWLKFGKLHEYAGQIGAEFVASGHYARIGVEVSRCRGVERMQEGTHCLPSTPGHLDTSTPSLLRGLDPSKDQSYVLFGMPRGQLGRTLLPIGALQKSRVRELAKEFGLPVFDKPDSQEICFVPDNDYAGLVERRRPEAVREGRILDAEGREVGKHGGQHRFTIGQRKGVGVALGHPIYVVGKDPMANTVTIGSREDLMCTGCTAGEANWLVDEARIGPEWFACRAKYRYNTPAVAAQARRLGDGDEATASGRRGRFEVKFRESQVAVAPGQAVVLYGAEDPDAVLGGGWIASVERAH